MNLEAEFSAHWNRHFSLNQHNRILLAVSGGPDSMALLHLMHVTQKPFSVAHCNFNLRGAESDADEQLVIETCQKLKIDYFCTRFNTSEYSKQHGLSIQLAARQLRYTWFEELCSTHGFTHIATAHQYDDQAETILMNIIRGTGIKGVSGIPLSNEKIIRPLLFAHKTQLVQYLQNNNFLFRTDASNQENKYLRNAIRNQIIPALNKLNPQAATHLFELGNHAKFVNHIVTQKIESLKTQYCKTENNIFHIHYNPISSLEYAPYFLFELISEFGFNTTQCEQIHNAFIASHSGSCFYSHTHELSINRDAILIAALPQTQATDICFDVLPLPNQSIMLGSTEYIFELIHPASISEYLPQHLYLDANALSFPLQIRPWAQGDRFTPLGNSGSKKISDFLIDRKIALIHKRGVFVIESQKQIAGIIGLQVSHKFRVLPSTASVLHIYTKEENNN